MFIIDFAKFFVYEWSQRSILQKIVLLLGCLACLIPLAFVVFLASFVSWKDLIFFVCVIAVMVVIFAWAHTMAVYTSWRENKGLPVKYATNFGPN